MSSWYEIALKLRLPNIVETDDKTVLESLLRTLVQESSLKTRRPPEVVMSGLVTLSKSVSLPLVTNTTCFDFQVNAENCVFTPGPQKQQKPLSVKPRAEEQLKTTRPISGKDREKMRKSRNKISDETQASIQKQLALMNNEKFGKPKPSSENWVPEESRFRFIHRSLGTMQENLKALQVLETCQEREMKRFQFLSSLTERAKTEESLTMTKKISCACCGFKFLYVNLPLKVSQKAILDIRVKWSGGLNSSSVFGKSQPIANVNEGEDELGEGGASKDDEDGSSGNIPVPVDSFTDRLSAVPRCYNEVLVCLFCSQFFQQQEDYRPSFQKIYYDERKAQHFETLRREREYWDPLKMVEKYREAEEKKLQDTLAAEATKQTEEGVESSLA